VEEDPMKEKDELRNKLLIELYNQLWNSINTRLNLTWQSIGVLVSAFAIFALTEKNIISLNYAAALIIVISAWFLAHIIDMSFWYNRNLVMIANIERLFLSVKDVKLLYPYFIEHRPKNKMVRYLVIQEWLAFGIAAIVILLHLFKEIIPVVQGINNFEGEIIIPYLVILICIILLLRLKRSRDKEYDDFLKTSPGKDITKEAKELAKLK
jgi:hypothetical protein